MDRAKLYLIFDRCSFDQELTDLAKIQFQNWFLQAPPGVKIQFVELDFSKLIFQKSNTDQQEVKRMPPLCKFYIIKLSNQAA